MRRSRLRARAKSWCAGMLSEDSVPARLRHIALVAVDGVHHELESRIDDRARLLGVEVFHQVTVRTHPLRREKTGS